MERQPNNEEQPETRYYVEYNGDKIYFTKENTIVYMHSECAEVDHFYLTLDDGSDDEGRAIGHYGWRRYYREQGAEDLFNEMMLHFTAIGCSRVLKAQASEFDLEQYKQRFGELPEQPAQPTEFTEPELHELTPRQERTMHFLAYLLQNDRLMPEDFELDGELYL